jgi:D-3-phosphoglycerate dehydrogenase
MELVSVPLRTSDRGTGIKRLKFIAKHGVGVDKIDVQAARAIGIVVMNTPGVNVSAHVLAHRSRRGN